MNLFDESPVVTADRSNPSPLPISGSYNSLFKVLCIFPSRYLCAIGLGLIFSVRRYSPPILALCSQTVRLAVPTWTGTAFILQGYHLLCRRFPATFGLLQNRDWTINHISATCETIADSVDRKSTRLNSSHLPTGLVYLVCRLLL